MKAPVVVIWLLIVACVAVDLAVIRELQLSQATWPERTGILGIGLAFGQQVLVTAWMVWGRWNLLVRVAVTVCATFGLGWLGASSEAGASQSGVWFSAMLIFLALLAAPMLAARLMGYSVLRPEDTDDQQRRRSLRARQFSIWSLLTVMTAVAVILGVLRYADWLQDDLVAAILFFTVFSIATCIVLFCGLFFRARIVGLVVTLLVSPVAGYCLSRTGLTANDTREMIELSCLQGLVVIVGVLVLRSAGYVMERDAVAIADSTESESSADGTKTGPSQHAEP
jgi:hypothetical protein